jgi:hypothetical protein
MISRQTPRRGERAGAQPKVEPRALLDLQQQRAALLLDLRHPGVAEVG